MGCGGSAHRVAPAPLEPKVQEEEQVQKGASGPEKSQKTPESPSPKPDAPEDAGKGGSKPVSLRAPGEEPAQQKPAAQAGETAPEEAAQQQPEAQAVAAAAGASDAEQQQQPPPGEKQAEGDSKGEEPARSQEGAAPQQQQGSGPARIDAEEGELLPDIVKKMNHELAKETPGSEAHQRILRCNEVYQLMKREYKAGTLMKSMEPPSSDEEAKTIMTARRDKELANQEEVRRLMKENAEAARQAIAAGDEPLQKQVPPTCWAMTLWQWRAYVSNCMEAEEYKQLKEEKGFVTLYDMNTLFVRPQTRGTGSGVALLLNRSRPLAAQVMVSHAWGECIEECMEAFQNLCVPDDTVIWFCLFANYQPGDEQGDVGPPIGWQLSLRPFQQVIHSEALMCMVVAHTTREEVYNRLWCVHEIDEAISSNVQPWAACSFKYVESSQESVEPLCGANDSSIEVSCAGARCGRPEDEAAIREVVAANGGFERLDKVVLNFRRSMVEYNQMVAMFAFLSGPRFIQTAMRMIWANAAKLVPSDLQFFVSLAPQFAQLPASQ